MNVRVFYMRIICMSCVYETFSLEKTRIDIFSVCLRMYMYVCVRVRMHVYVEDIFHQ